MTTDVIDQLVSAHKSRRQLLPYSLRFLLWIVSSASIIGLILFVTGHRPDLWVQLHKVSFWGEIMASVCTCVIAAWASFRLSIPQREKPWLVFALGIPMLVLGLFLIQKFIFYVNQGSKPDFFAHYHCMYIVFAMSFFPILLILWLFKKALPIKPIQAGFLACLSGGAVSLVGIKLFCPLDTFWHIFLWHMAPFLGLGVLGAFFGKRFFKL